MKAQQYAEALYGATYGKPADELDRLVANFVRIVDTRGHIRLFPAILREFEIISEQRAVADVVTLRLARRDDEVRYREHIERDVHAIGATGLPVTIVTDDTAVGGYEVQARGKRIDRTYKRSLLALYSHLITHS
jgi:F0F1-type ATP synthase delta subunit